MKSILMVSIFFISSMTFTVEAIECPKYNLECNYQIVTKEGDYSVINSLHTRFVGTNTDEPSLPDNECVAKISFKSKKARETLNIFVRDDLLTFLYIGYPYGARNPQFSFEATPEKEMTLINGDEKITCALRDPNAPQDD